MGLIIFGVVLVGIIVLEIRLKKAVPEGQVSNDPLTGKQKALVWVLCFFNPLLGGAILYYGWRKRLPVKAKSANRISWLVFGLTILVVVALRTLGLA